VSAQPTVLWVGVGHRPAAAPPEEFQTLHAEGALDGLKRLADRRVDCVVCPLSVSDLDPVAFVEVLREDHPDVPVVLTGEDDGRGSRALAAGATAVVADDAVADRVRRTVTRRRADDAVAGHAALRATVADVAIAVVEAEGRPAADRAVHDALAGSDRYRHVWVGEYADGDLQLRAPFGARLDAGEVATIVGTDDDVVGRAVRERAVTVAEGDPASGTGRTAPRAVAAVPLLDGDSVEGVVVLATDAPDAFDASERDALADLGSVVGSLVGDADAGLAAENLVHELRNPVGAALAHLDIARESSDEAAFERVEEHLRELDHLVEDVLGGAGVDDPETERVALEDVVSEAWETVPTDEGELVVEDAGTVAADRVLLVRLLSNLFRNAVEHGATSSRPAADDAVENGATSAPSRSREDGAGDDGAVTAGDGVTVSVGTLDGGAGFYVADDGAGIPASERERVFERGYSGDGGLGVGLALVADIAAAHGWEVTAEESASGGARFVVRTD
jgi:two-component system OmpR family sensor kinase